MIRRRLHLNTETRSDIRGGRGRAEFVPYLAKGDMACVDALSVLTLEPGTTIGAHPHPDTEELYWIVSGTGTGELDGERFPVGPGDAWVCKAGHSHAIACDPSGPLTFLAVITQAPS